MDAPIFICYRRDDTIAEAGRLRDAIANTFSQRTVFLDHSSINAGEEWPKKLRNQLMNASVVVAIIGPQWLVASDEFGRRRIDDQDDWVRRELETALSSKKLLLPVLVGNTKLPPSEAMPQSLRPLLDRQAIELRHSFWDHDVKLVLESIKNALTPDQLQTVKRGPYPVPPAEKPDPISHHQLQAALSGVLKNWNVVESPLPEDKEVTRVELSREYEFSCFRDAIDFMYQLAPGCDIAIHHPRWENIWRNVACVPDNLGHRTPNIRSRCSACQVL